MKTYEHYVTVAGETVLINHLATLNEHTNLILEELEPHHFRNEGYKSIFQIAKEMGSDFNFAILQDKLVENSLVTAKIKAFKDLENCFVYFSEEEIRKIIKYLKEVYLKIQLGLGIRDFSVADIYSLALSQETENAEILNSQTMTRFIEKLIAQDSEIIPFPYKSLNAILTGYKKAEYTIVAARPSVGKSMFLEQMFWQSIRLGKKALFISAEMSVDTILKRQILRKTGINLFKTVVDRENKANLYLGIKEDLGNGEISASNFTVSDIEKQITDKKPDIVFVDYLQKLIVKNSRLSEYEQVTQITKQLSGLRTKYNIALVVASQYSRTSETQPNLKDLRSSGQIEQDADLVISLWKDKNSAYSNEYDKVFVDCLKNRNGITFGNSKSFEYFLMFEKGRVRFLDEDETLPADYVKGNDYAK